MATCAACGKSIRIGGVFCNAACKQKAYREKRDNGFKAFWRECACGCGEKTLIKNWQSERRHKYAFDACRKRAQRARMKKEKQKRTCEMCEKETQKKYCSPKCKQKAYRMRKRDKKLAEKTRQELREFWQS